MRTTSGNFNMAWYPSSGPTNNKPALLAPLVHHFDTLALKPNKLRSEFGGALLASLLKTYSARLNKCSKTFIALNGALLTFIRQGLAQPLCHSYGALIANVITQACKTRRCADNKKSVAIIQGDCVLNGLLGTHNTIIPFLLKF